MYEEIIINGKTMELDAKSKGVQMVLQSPYLTDIKAIISNRTNTVTFPGFWIGRDTRWRVRLEVEQ